MVDKLPLLISRSDVIFPNTTRELEVGRDFSVSAINASVMEFGGYLAVTIQKNGDADKPQADDIYTIGCIARVEVLNRNKDGSMKIKLDGMNRVNILEATQKSEKDSWYVKYSVLKEKNTYSTKYRDMINDFLADRPEIFNWETEAMKSILAVMQTQKPNLSEVTDKLADLWPKDNMNSVSLKQELLSETNVSKRVEMIVKTPYITTEIKNELDSQISRKVGKNISRQQKEFYLREKLKVIREELGDSSSKEVEINRIKARLEKETWPAHVRSRIKEELHKLEYSSSYSNEAMVIRGYIDWIMSLPWDKCSKDEEDLNKIKEVLDVHHQGLEKIKERILEFIAVQKRSKDPKGSIICLVGPPGVGKTSLAQAIAKSLNKEFVKISLGGLSDESELRGHRKTYVASMPGRIIRALRQAKVKNPVFLLDEMDKISSNYHGDPAHALLEILDPKQNSKFSDNYIEETFDLSKVMFIATANYEDNIPDPLYNRLEIIHLSSYTEKEKLEIAKSHLIAEVLKEHGVSEGELTFSDESLLLIIQKYTKEAGIRNFKNMLSKIARKFVKRTFLEPIKKEHVTPEVVRKYLEQEIYDFTVKDEIAIPGIVNGMAYTEFGGDLLPIEVNYMSGKGNLSLTGNLKDTMRESANVALGFVRANEEAFQIKGIDWNNVDINLHVPSGGIPKDGPSAGVTISTAMISAFTNRAVPTNIAMTGEITLRGKVLPIGGLKEKIISAVRGGVVTVIIPKANERHLADIPKEIMEKITVVPVREYREIYDYIFGNNLIAENKKLKSKSLIKKAKS